MTSPAVLSSGWVRLVRLLPAGPRIALVRAGRLPMSALGARERARLNAALDAAISRRAASTNIGAMLAAEGITIVTMEGGRLLQHHPDGTSVVLDQPV